MLKFTINVVFLICVLSLTNSSDAFAQADEIRERLKEFKIDGDWLSSNVKSGDAVHYYKMSSTTGSPDGNVESISEYDPRKKVGKRWNLLTVNGAEPTKKQNKQFNQFHNPKYKDINGSIDPDSYKIERDDDKFLVVKFRYLKESLPGKYRFLGDCDARVYCKKDIMRVTYAEFVNFRPTKVKMFNVKDLLVELYYTFDEESQSYVHQEARLDIKALIFGQEQEVEMINYYSDYKVVK